MRTTVAYASVRIKKTKYTKSLSLQLKVPTAVPARQYSENNISCHIRYGDVIGLGPFCYFLQQLFYVVSRHQCCRAGIIVYCIRLHSFVLLCVIIVHTDVGLLCLSVCSDSFM